MSLWNFINRALGNLRKGLLINSITVISITIALMLLGGYLLILNNLSRWIHVSEAELTIRCFLVDNVTAEQIDSLNQKLLSMPEVARIDLINADLARQIFLKKHPDFADLVGKQNPFQPYLVLHLKEHNTSKTKAFAEGLQPLAGIDGVDYGGLWLERYVAIRGTLQIISYLLAAMIIISSIFLVANTVRLNIFTRREEIEIFKLVGGTKLFIATPFIIEGLILGFTGGLLALITLMTFFKASLSGMHQELNFLSGGHQLRFLDVRSVLLLMGVALGSGFFGSLISLRRFLRYQYHA